MRSRRNVAPMTTWKAFTESAPRIAAIFHRRYAATGNLCMLATIRADGFPRISPIEPQIFEDDLLIVGMPNTLKFRDLGRDPRFCLHTASISGSQPRCSNRAGWICADKSSITSTPLS
jgi:predicted pyridoxine 5'-phosphate oxidase superfamily flavin-nucleotide-binding protein